jgi:hypothetical protein
MKSISLLGLSLGISIGLLSPVSPASAQSFTTLDQNPSTIQVVADGRNVFQLRKGGDVQELLSGRWVSVDKGATNTQMIQADRNFLYVLKGTGQVWSRWNGKWDMIRDKGEPGQQIRAIGGRLYLLQRDGHVLKYAGSGLNWQQIDDGNSVKMICADNMENLYELKTNGLIFQLFAQDSFNKMDDGNNQQIDAGGGSLYSLRGDGHIYRKREGADWEMIDKGVGTLQIKAEADNFYALKANGEIWYYHGDSWAQVQDQAPGAAAIEADSGNLFIQYRNGLVQMATSRELTRLWSQNVRRSVIRVRGPQSTSK